MVSYLFKVMEQPFVLYLYLANSWPKLDIKGFVKVTYCKLLITCSCTATSLCQLCDGSWVHGSLRQCGQEN